MLLTPPFKPTPLPIFSSSKLLHHLPIKCSSQHSSFPSKRLKNPMDSKTKSNGETAIIVDLDNSSKSNKVKPAIAYAATTKAVPRMKRGVAIFDFILRIFGLAAALTATITMGTTGQTLPFFTQFFQFQASYDDLPTFTFFVVANGIASGYLVLSLPFSIIAIVRPHASGIKILLIIFDTVLVALTTSAAAAAAAIVYLAHNGNSNTNWFAICQQFDDFCQRVSGAVVASFIAVVIFIFLVLLAAVALSRR